MIEFVSFRTEVVLLSHLFAKKNFELTASFLLICFLPPPFVSLVYQVIIGTFCSFLLSELSQIPTFHLSRVLEQ